MKVFVSLIKFAFNNFLLSEYFKVNMAQNLICYVLVEVFLFPSLNLLLSNILYITYIKKEGYQLITHTSAEEGCCNSLNAFVNISIYT